jgi:xylan 1,4-beta-xylosidase
VFTDIFEETGPRFEAFHGGFGLMNAQGIKKPAYFSYQYLNRLGPTELENDDASSWATTDEEGNVQLLIWDYTHTLPEGINNQQYYSQDLPARGKGSVDIRVAGLAEGAYTLHVAQTGYRRNDAYTAYIAMGSPAQLTQAQVARLKSEARGSALERREIPVGDDGVFTTRLPMRENDVYLIELTGDLVAAVGSKWGLTELRSAEASSGAPDPPSFDILAGVMGRLAHEHFCLLPEVPTRVARLQPFGLRFHAVRRCGKRHA